MTIETEDVVAGLRSWPAITQGDALSASTVALLMEKAADEIERLRSERQFLSDRIDVLEGALKTRVTDAADNLAGELHDPGTEALAAIHCARALTKEAGIHGQ